MALLEGLVRIPRPRYEEYPLIWSTWDLRSLKEKGFQCNPCEIGVTSLQDHKEVHVDPNKVKGLDWSNKLMILTKLGRRIGSKSWISWKWVLWAQWSHQPKRDLGRRSMFKLELEISWDSTVVSTSSLEDLSKRPQRSSWPIFKDFQWLEMILDDALGGLLG